MPPDDPARQRLGLFLAWGALVLASGGMFAVGVRIRLFDLHVVDLLLYAFLVFDLGKVGVEVLAER